MVLINPKQMLIMDGRDVARTLIFLMTKWVPLTEALKADIGKKQLADASSHEQVN